MRKFLEFLTRPALAADENQRLLAAFADVSRSREPRTLAEAEAAEPWDDDASGFGVVAQPPIVSPPAMRSEFAALFCGGPWTVAWRFPPWTVRLDGPGPATLVRGDPLAADQPGSRLIPGEWTRIERGPIPHRVGLLADTGEWVVLERQRG